MEDEIYSSGLVSQSFWFIEMKKIIKLVSEDKNLHRRKLIWSSKGIQGKKNLWIFMEKS